MKQVVCPSALLLICVINVATYGQRESSLYSRQSYRAKARTEKADLPKKAAGPAKKASVRTEKEAGRSEKESAQSLVASLPPLPKSSNDSSRSRLSAQGQALPDLLVDGTDQASELIEASDSTERIAVESPPTAFEAPTSTAIATTEPNSTTLLPGNEEDSHESLSAPESRLAQPQPLLLESGKAPESREESNSDSGSEPWYELGQYGLIDSDSVITSVVPNHDSLGVETVGYSSGLVESNPGYALKTPISTRRARQTTRAGSGTREGVGYSFLSFFKRRFGFDKGLGHERVMFAPFALDTATSLPSTSITLSAAHGLGTPDRLEYFWASPQIGPAAESRVDVLDTVFRTELGNRKAMAIASYTMRSLNPERNDNTTGFGDMTVGGKVLLVDGKCTQIASIFQTYLKTGPADRGLGTGHVSLEPGILFRQQLSELTFVHAEAKYWIPIAGREGFAGDVLKLGAGVSTIWKESDRHALMPTLELLTYNFLAGSKTDALGNTVRVNGNFAAEVLPGLRCAFGESALGMHEFGVSAGTKIADRDWFDTRLLFQLRFVR